MIIRRELLMPVLLPVGPLVELVRGSEPTTPPTVPFLKPLQIPPLLSGDTDITMRVGAAQILQNGPATVRRFDGTLMCRSSPLPGA